MDRRSFLRTSILASPAILVSRGRVFARPAARKILVVGAGLAGLVAAYELKKLGHDVTVFEAQGRPGGRVFTLRSFGEGLWADAGAARIPDDHHFTLKYVKEFDLPLIPFYPKENKFRRLNNGKPETVDWNGFRDATSWVMSLDKPDRWRKINGGNDLLPKAFARDLGNAIHFESPVVKIEQDTSRVRVTVKSRGSLQTVEADHLICAIPTTMLASVDLAGALSEAKIDAIKAVGYDTASRVFLETRRRFWEDEKLNGFGFGDDAAEVWNSTFGETGTHGILQTYLRGGFSRDLTGLSEPERIQYTTKKLSVLFPQLKGNTVGGVSKCWSEDPWVKGAWAHISPNSADLIRSPERRIYFAGEHLSGNPSWMQGALESGLRAVSEISISTAAIVRSI